MDLLERYEEKNLMTVTVCLGILGRGVKIHERWGKSCGGCHNDAGSLLW